MPRGGKALTRKGCQGHATLEMALVLLPFFLMVMGVVEFGWYFLHQHTLQFATREGMRLALVGSRVQDDQGDLMTREASIISTIKEQASWVMNPEKVNVWIFQVGSTYEDPEDWQSLLPIAGDPAEYMRVKVRYDYDTLTPLIGAFVSAENPFTMWAEATYRNELFQEE